VRLIIWLTGLKNAFVQGMSVKKRPQRGTNISLSFFYKWYTLTGYCLTVVLGIVFLKAISLGYRLGSYLAGLMLNSKHIGKLLLKGKVFFG
jgi:hypothetical protein